MELSGRFYIQKRKPVGSEAQGHKGEGWDEEEDLPQTPPREDTCSPCQRNSPIRTLTQQTALWYLSCVSCSWMPWNGFCFLRTGSGYLSTVSFLNQLQEHRAVLCTSVVTRVLRSGLGSMTLMVKGEMSWPGPCVLTGPFGIFLLSETGCEWFTLASLVGHQFEMEEWDPSVGSLWLFD